MPPLATIISLILGIPWTLGVLWMLVFLTGLNRDQMLLFSVVFPVLYILVPLSYLVYAMNKGTISDIDITKRQERYELLSIIFVVNVLAVLVAWRFGNATLLYSLLTIFIIFGLVYGITFFWKISLHMTINTMGITLLNALTGWQHLYLYILIPIVFWSRYHMKKHTAPQLIVAFILTGGIMMGLLKYFGFY